MLRKLSKIFLVLSVFFGLASIGLLISHTYFNDTFFDSITGMQHPASRFFKPDARTVTILIAGDSGSNNYVLENVINDARRVEPHYDFMMHLGDMAVTGSITGYYWMLEEIRPRLGNIPLYAVPGNHDVTQHVGFGNERNKNIAFYSTVMGPAYYWFSYGDTLFIALDSSMEEFDDEQIVWLNDTLRKIRPMFRHCVVFNHVPPVNTCPECAFEHTLSQDAINQLEKIFKQYKVDAMFNGHVHFYSETKFAGVPTYTVTSSGQGVRDLKNSKYGYLVVKIDKNGVHVTPHYIAHNGALREFFEEWWARDILSVKSQELLSVLLNAFVLCLVLGVGFRIADKRRHTK